MKPMTSLVTVMSVRLIYTVHTVKDQRVSPERFQLQERGHTVGAELKVVLSVNENVLFSIIGQKCV